MHGIANMIPEELTAVPLINSLVDGEWRVDTLPRGIPILQQHNTITNDFPF